MKLYWTKEASIQLQEIEKYISKDDPQKAIKFVNSLISASEKIPANPDRGRIVPELSIGPIREIIFKNYRIVYIRKKSEIEILTVFEGQKLLNESEILKNI